MVVAPLVNSDDVVVLVKGSLVVVVLTGGCGGNTSGCGGNTSGCGGDDMGDRDCFL